MRCLLLILFVALSVLLPQSCDAPGSIEDLEESLTPEQGETGKDEPSDGDAPDTPVLKALTVAEAQALYDAETEQPVTVTGYIVGAIKGTSLKGAQFTPPFESESNILIADSADADTVTACLPVQLTKGTKPRNELNLQSNPHLLGTKVTVTAQLEKYFRTAGLKSVSHFTLF